MALAGSVFNVLVKYGRELKVMSLFGKKPPKDMIPVTIDLCDDYFVAEGDEVIKIINEEAPACYSGQKGADDVVSVIQNRVQLYVNENR